MGSKKNYFNVFPKTKLVPFTRDPRWFPGQSLRENVFLTRNAVDRSYRHCHLTGRVNNIFHLMLYIITKLKNGVYHRLRSRLSWKHYVTTTNNTLYGSWTISHAKPNGISISFSMTFIMVVKDNQLVDNVIVLLPLKNASAT